MPRAKASLCSRAVIVLVPDGPRVHELLLAVVTVELHDLFIWEIAPSYLPTMHSFLVEPRTLHCTQPGVPWSVPYIYIYTHRSQTKTILKMSIWHSLFSKKKPRLHNEVSITIDGFGDMGRWEARREEESMGKRRVIHDSSDKKHTGGEKEDELKNPAGDRMVSQFFDEYTRSIGELPKRSVMAWGEITMKITNDRACWAIAPILSLFSHITEDEKNLVVMKKPFFTQKARELWDGMKSTKQLNGLDDFACGMGGSRGILDYIFLSDGKDLNPDFVRIMNTYGQLLNKISPLNEELTLFWNRTVSPKTFNYDIGKIIRFSVTPFLVHATLPISYATISLIWHILAKDPKNNHFVACIKSMTGMKPNTDSWVWADFLEKGKGEVDFRKRETLMEILQLKPNDKTQHFCIRKAVGLSLQEIDAEHAPQHPPDMEIKKLKGSILSIEPSAAYPRQIIVKNGDSPMGEALLLMCALTHEHNEIIRVSGKGVFLQNFITVFNNTLHAEALSVDYRLPKRTFFRKNCVGILEYEMETNFDIVEAIKTTYKWFEGDMPDNVNDLPPEYFVIKCFDKDTKNWGIVDLDKNRYVYHFSELMSIETGRYVFFPYIFKAYSSHLNDLINKEK